MIQVNISNLFLPEWLGTSVTFLLQEEFILRGVKVLPNTYKSGQKVILYQNPKSGKVFENTNNAKAEAISFIVATFFLLILIIFAFCVIKY